MTPAEQYTNPAGHRERLRKRFLMAGRGALADYELLELLLTYAIPRVNTKPLAKALLHRFGTFVNVLQQPYERLMEIKGIGSKTATFIQVVQASLTRSMEADVEQQLSISGPEDIFAFVRLHLGARSHECVYAFYLNNSNHVVHQAEVGMGTVDRTPLYPREILKPALVYDATGIILVHNHPEGQPVPSEDDLEMTTRLEEVAAHFGIRLLDHMIVTRLQAYSIKKGKLL
ncbi:MAG: DNA repair protein RadC [Deltaproteobacteria bacterium]|nr:DNA repair protein RadC [Deltaproteobacteria bacterium]